MSILLYLAGIVIAILLGAAAQRFLDQHGRARDDGWRQARELFKEDDHV